MKILRISLLRFKVGQSLSVENIEFDLIDDM